MKKYQLAFLLGVLMVVLFTSIVTFQLESKKRILQEDLIELSKVKYGLFSVDEWETILTDIITERINDFDLDDTNKEELRKKIASFLEIAISELEVAYKEEEGFLKRTGASIFDVFGHMKRKIPEITEGILTFMNDPENRGRVKDYLLGKMSEYSEQTFSEIDYTDYNKILLKYDAQNKDEAIIVLKTNIMELESRRYPYSMTLYLTVTLLFILTMVIKEIGKTDFTVLTLICMVLLLAGLLLPMINIDARVSQMNFHLLGEDISFTDQVLYFKSKSILEVVTLMLSDSKPEVMLVGFMVLLFSVLFPFSKLISSVIYLYAEKLRNSKFLKFLVFKTAKWSMADVMVVAIFMAYIGFSGIVTEQLKDLESIALNLDLLTTNASDLQIGFFIFTSFAVLSTGVSYKLQYSLKGD